MAAVILATCTGSSKLFHVTQCRRASSSRCFDGSQRLRINLTAFQVYWTYLLRTWSDYDRSKLREPRNQRQRATSYKISEAIPQRDSQIAHCWYRVTISLLNVWGVVNAAAATTANDDDDDGGDDDDDDDSCVIWADADTNSNHSNADTLSLRWETLCSKRTAS